MELFQIETERLFLRRLTPADYIKAFEVYTKEQVKELLALRTEEDYLKEKFRYDNGYSTYNRSFEQFQLIDKKNNYIFGQCVFHNWAIDHRRAELGYSILDDSYKRKGYMYEALKSILNHGFTNMNLHRIEALVEPNNIASLQLLAKFQFKYEGKLREHYLKDGVFEDSIFFSKLQSEHTIK